MPKFRLFLIIAALTSPASFALAQNPSSPASQPAVPAATAQPASADSTPTDPATREILSAVKGYGAKLDVPVLSTSGTRYRAMVGDQINVLFTIVKALNETVTVRPDGTISLIGAPDVYVERQTMPEIMETIRKAYAGILQPPVLFTVTLANIENPYFVVGGQVVNPGKYHLKGDLTVAQSIPIAGGYLLGTAKDSRVILFRRVSNDWIEAKLIDLKRILNKGDLADDIHLQSGDLVFVPKNRLSKVEPFLSYFMLYNIFNINFGTSYRISGD